MSGKLIISVSGMRGVVGEKLTPTVAAEYACAFGSFLKRTAADTDKTITVCIGRDTRGSGQMLTSAVVAGLTSLGIDTIDLGIVTTPGVGIMTRHMTCSGALVITASHNPGQYNGIKLLLSNGAAPPPELSERIKKLYYDKDFDFVGSYDSGQLRFAESTDDIHIARILPIVDKEKVKAGNLKVVLDSVNGTGAQVTKKLLTELGCQVVAINDEPTGIFAHPPEPLAENLGELCERVKQEKADIGFAQDPDADRLAIVDETGRYIGEEYTLALAAKSILSTKIGPVATNLSTSRMIDDIAGQFGVKVIRTAVGEANVAAAMLENNCLIGGEGNGGVIDLRIGPVRDSLVGIVLTLQLVSDTGKTISELGDGIPGYYMIKEKFPANESQLQEILCAANKEFSNANNIDKTDGCRFDFEEGWIHLRASNTEPVMRVIIEAKDRQAAEKYLDKIKQIHSRADG